MTMLITHPPPHFEFPENMIFSTIILATNIFMKIIFYILKMSADGDAQAESISFSITQPNPVQLPQYYYQECEEKKEEKKKEEKKKNSTERNVYGWRAKAESTEEDPFLQGMIAKLNKDHERKMALANVRKRKRPDNQEETKRKK
jgi:hypothetical protein